MLKQQHQLFASVFALADAVVIAGVAMVAWVFRVEARGELYPQSWENYIKEPLLLVAIPVGLMALKGFGLYRPRRDKLIIGEVGQIAKAAAVATVGVIATLWVFGADIIVNSENVAVFPYEPGGRWLTNVDAARVQLPAFGVLFFLGLSAHRVILRLTLRQLRDRGWNQRTVAIIGSGRLAQSVVTRLAANSWTGLSATYLIDHHADRDEQPSPAVGLPVLGGIADLEQILTDAPVDGVYIALPQHAAALLPELLDRLERFAIDVRIVPDFTPRYVARHMIVSELEGMPVISYRECPTHGVGGISKRALDIFGSIVGLIIFAPLILLIAIAIRVTSPGRAIFKQRRVGLGGEVFKIYKFRTMYVRKQTEGSPDSGWTTRDDPRITRLGSFLRRTSLDELPQLVNVLQGRMSLVGPRPERPELIETFKKDRRRYMLRQHVKAGMTGWAQVNGLRGDTCLRKRLQYDLFYVKNWSLRFDIRILFETIFRGFVHRNAH